MSNSELSTGREQALAALRATALRVGHDRLATELDRLGPITVASTRHISVADHLYSAVLGQQLSLKAASTIRGRVQQAARALGVPVTDLYVPSQEATLRACGVSGRKVRSLQAILAADGKGLLAPADLAHMPHAERMQRLCGIWGVGKWTADMIGIFYFLEEDIWPEGDATAVAMFRQHTGLEDTLLATQPCAPHRSYLARYMWASRDKGDTAPST